MIDTKAIEEHIKGILVALGEDPEREGLIETPARVARMYEEVFQGIAYSNSDIAKMFGKTFEAPANAGPVIVRDIQVFSYCEHHMALMYDMSVNVAYIPKDRVIGLSKIARYGCKAPAAPGKARLGYRRDNDRGNRLSRRGSRYSRHP